eukprot:217713_1
MQNYAIPRPKIEFNDTMKTHVRECMPLLVDNNDKRVLCKAFRHPLTVICTVSVSWMLYICLTLFNGFFITTPHGKPELRTCGASITSSNAITNTKQCGLMAEYCAPEYAPSEYQPFYCPAKCGDNAIVLNDVFGGKSNIFHPSSSLCKSAMYAGFIDPFFGGTAMYRIEDKQWSFPINNDDDVLQ